MSRFNDLYRKGILGTAAAGLAGLLVLNSPDALAGGKELDFYPQSGAPHTMTYQDESGKEVVAKLEFDVVIKKKEPYGIVNDELAVKYYFDLVLKESGGIAVDFEKVTRYLSSGLLQESDKERGASWISRKCGSTHLDENSQCFMSNRWFFSTDSDDSFFETWHGTDLNGKRVHIEYKVPILAYFK